jgi:2-polyprenyl-6-methoxyphenol hydroxylase-like FAD-dependent oxidoreductase
VNRPERVLVVGGGIAGLACARALAGRGIGCDVVERSRSWPESGTGFYLPGNSVRALSALGIGTALLERAARIPRQRFLDHRGRLLFEIELPTFWRDAGACVAIARADLHELLRDGVQVRLATEFAELDAETLAAYDLVIGADGIRSSVRASMGGAEASFVGQASWRFVVGGADGIACWTVWLGRGKTFLALPLGGGRVYCYADVNVPEPVDPTAGDRSELAALFGGFAEPVGSLLAAAGPVYFSPIEEVVQRPWVRDGVVLVGDAAHAMSPNMAQGAGLALEDALVLAGTVADGLTLEAYETRRRGRVEFVLAQTHRRDATRGLPPLVRNATLRLAGRRIYRGNYAPLLRDP